MENEFNKLDDKIIDVDEISGTEIKINPDYYIHTALLKAQAAIVDEDMAAGLSRFRMVVEHIEILARAAKMLPTDYDENIKTYLESEEFKEKDVDLKSGFKIANKKLGLMMSMVFSSKVSTEPLKA